MSVRDVLVISIVMINIEVKYDVIIFYLLSVLRNHRLE